MELGSSHFHDQRWQEQPRLPHPSSHLGQQLEHSQQESGGFDHRPYLRTNADQPSSLTVESIRFAQMGKEHQPYHQPQHIQEAPTVHSPTDPIHYPNPRRHSHPDQVQTGSSHIFTQPTHQALPAPNSQYWYDPSVHVSTQLPPAAAVMGGGGRYPFHHQYQQQAAEPVLPTEESSSKHHDSDASVPENPLIEAIDQEMLLAQDEVHKISADSLESFGDPNFEIPFDPNLVCPKCGSQFRRGEIQVFKRHYGGCAGHASQNKEEMCVPENELIAGIDQDMKQAAEEVTRMTASGDRSPLQSRGPAGQHDPKDRNSD